MKVAYVPVREGGILHRPRTVPACCACSPSCPSYSGYWSASSSPWVSVAPPLGVYLPVFVSNIFKR